MSDVSALEPTEREPPESAGSGALDEASYLTLRPLSVRDEDGECIVGDVSQGNFVALPALAADILEAIGAGRALGEVAAIARERAGQEVDVQHFAGALIELGFVTHVDGVPLDRRQNGRLSDGGRFGLKLARASRPLWSRAAWAVYAVLFVACAALLILQPGYRPQAKQLFLLHDPLASVAIVAAVASVLEGLHEAAHWLAARASGVPARITISRRWYLLVLQTDLTSLWSLPRHKRFGPLLAGMAFDTVLLSALLAGRVAVNAGWWHPSTLVWRLMLALLLERVVGLVFQFLVFLRTDLYAVLTIGLGCRNLTRVNHLMLKRRLHCLRDHEATELADAHPRDRQVARWYGWLYAAGLVLAIWYFAAVFWVWVVTIAGWIAARLGPLAITRPAFWEAAVFSVLATAPLFIPAAMIARDLSRQLPRRPRTPVPRVDDVG